MGRSNGDGTALRRDQSRFPRDARRKGITGGVHRGHVVADIARIEDWQNAAGLRIEDTEQVHVFGENSRNQRSPYAGKHDSGIAVRTQRVPTPEVSRTIGHREAPVRQANLS